MSKESLLDLNRNTLIGFTDKRGTAWHDSRQIREENGLESNHYAGAVPVEDVRRRLFGWTAVEGSITASATFFDEDGVTELVDSPPEYKAIMRSDTGKLLGIFKQGYQPHQYDEWLVQNVESILDADLQIGSAGLLKGGRVGWVQVEMEDTLEVKGVKYRPFLTAVTSFDGSLATRYRQGSQVVVCDNTLSVALGEKDVPELRVKHSRNSLGQLSVAREALQIVHSTADAFAEQVKKLTAQSVSDAQWAEFVARYTYTPSQTDRSKGMAERKAGDLNQLYNYDNRVAPWKGTAYGVLAAVNTYVHHFGKVQGATRAERNAERMVTGKVDTLDAGTLALLAKVR